MTTASSASTDMVILASMLEPLEAHLLVSVLENEGVRAHTGDSNLVQTDALIAIALGGVRVWVPASQLAAAKAVQAAYHRGDYALSDDFDVGATEK
jgi:hypothetical protein